MERAPAFTNAVGIHSRYEYREERSEGVVFSPTTGQMEPYSNLDAYYSQLTAHSRKPAPYQGDHHTAYDYWRGVNTVLRDKPYLLNFHWTNPTDGITSSYDTVGNEYISKRHGPFNYDPCYNPSLIDNAWNEATTKALLSLKGKTAEVGNALGEMKTTVEQLAKSVTRAGNFLLAVKKGRWKQAADILGISRRAFNDTRGRNQASMWLEYVYGWRPLAQTMYDLQDSFSAAVQRTSRLIEGNGTGTCGGSDQFPYGNWEVKGEWKASVKCTLRAIIDDAKIHLINSIGLTNPASVAWELVPFSFVVDWFVPVGNTLEAMNASWGLVWNGGYIRKIVNRRVWIKHKTGFITFWVNCIDPGDYQEGSTEFQRVALTGFPYAQFYADVTPFSTPRVVNAIALTRQLT